MGNKLSKTYNSAVNNYQGSVLTQNGSQIILTEEGRVINQGGWQYEYDLKDHLGNTRVSFKVDTVRAVPIQYKDYYPFGLEMATWNTIDGSPTKYLYNGKELQDDAGLDWYDYGARFYDPELGRWHNLDSQSEVYSSFSPYNYCLNNPLIYIDPNGEEVDYAQLYDKDKEGNYKYKQQIIAFELFASTKAGREYILSHAQKGFKLEGAFVSGLSIAAKASGSMHNEGVDVAFSAVKDYKVGEGGTEHKLTDNNSRLSINYVLDGGQTYMGSTPSELLGRTRNLAHEVFYHGDYYENRFSEFKKGNVSLNSKGTLWTKENTYHWLGLDNTQLGKVGVGLLREAQNIIQSNDASSILFQSKYPAVQKRTKSNLANPKTINELQQMLKYGLPKK